MGGKTSYNSIKKYKDKSYDVIGLSVYKGDRDIIKSVAKKAGKSTNQYIYDILREHVPGLQTPKEQ